VLITQQTGEAAIKRASVALPPGVATNTAAVANACSEDQVTAGTCPPAAQVGTVSATSELVEGTLSGPVLLVNQAGGLPKLVALLTGRVNLRLDGIISTSADGTRLINTFDGIPDVPLSSFALKINGGPSGLIQNRADLCDGAGSLEGQFTGHNEKTATVNAPLQLLGTCKPATAKKPRASMRLSGLASGSPVLSMTVRRNGSDAVSSIKSVVLRLAKGLRTTARKKRVRVRATAVRRRVKVGRRSVRITMPGTAARRVRANLRKGSLKASRRLQRKGKGARVRFRLRVKTAGGRTFRITVRVRARS
jgi:hypothetical protein